MECKKCGRILPEGGAFCPTCGTRNDGKMQCPNCKKIIQEDSQFCEYCGARLDGKEVCENCGAVLEGEFCAICGQKSAKKKSNNAEGSFGKYMTVEKILTPCLMLFAIVAMFICTFFLGINVDINGISLEALTGELVNADTNIFYYMGDSFDSTKRFFALSEKLSENAFSFAKKAFITIDTVMLVIVVLHLLVMSVALVVAGVKVGIGLYGKKEVKISKYFGGAVASFVTTVAIMLFTSYLKMTELRQSVKVILNDASIIGMVLAFIVCVATFILHAIAKGKKEINGSFISRKIVLFVAACLTIVAILLSGLGTIYMESLIESSEYSASAPALMERILLSWLTESSATDYTARKMLMYRTAMKSALAASLTTIVFIVILGWQLFVLIDALTNDKPLSVMALTFGALTFVLSVVNLVFGINFKETYVSITIGSVEEILEKVDLVVKLCGSVVATIVLVFIVFGLAIANLAIPKTEKKKN